MKDIKGIPYIANVKGDERQVVIILHGFDSSKDSPTAKMMLEELPKAGIGAIAFDMPGHGDNPVPREDLRVSGCMLALEAIEELAGELAPQAEISYFGSSFFLVIPSMAVTSSKPTTRPPSRAGIGSRFITPRLMAINAPKDSSVRIASVLFSVEAAVSVMICTIPTGPDRSWKPA